MKGNENNMASVKQHPVVPFDTLAYAGRLRDGGFDEKSATALTEALMGAFRGGLVTQEDLRVESDSLRKEIQTVRNELHAEGKSLRGEIQAVRNDLHAESKSLRGEIDKLNGRIIWMIVILGSAIGGSFALQTGLLLALLKVF